LKVELCLGPCKIQYLHHVGITVQRGCAYGRTVQPGSKLYTMRFAATYSQQSKMRRGCSPL
jgi:hypothetical protein